MNTNVVQNYQAANTQGQRGQQNPTGRDALQEVDISSFLKLMIVELQNQDPMNPMDNAQMLQQIGQIREIASNDRLSKTLDAVLLGQSMGTASSLLGKTIEGMTDKGDKVTGRVDKVTVVDGKPLLQVGDKSIELKNVSAMVPAGTTGTTTGGTTGTTTGGTTGTTTGGTTGTTTGGTTGTTKT